MKKPFLLLLVSLCVRVAWSEMRSLEVITTSLVTRETPARRAVHVFYESDGACGGLELWCFQLGRIIRRFDLPDAKRGTNFARVLTGVTEEEGFVEWELKAKRGRVWARANGAWTKVRPWTLYLFTSTHADIGLHEPPYWQRDMAVRYIDDAIRLIDADPDGTDPGAYRYVMEGTWYWGNYAMDRGKAAARRIADRHIRTGRLGVGATCAGNHTQAYGFEQVARSAYTRRGLREEYGLDRDTMLMVDNNGLSWGIVGPYASAGIRNVLFLPNQWNPLPSTIRLYDKDKPGWTWNPDALGGGTRVDVRWDSSLPMIFWWQGADKTSKLLVWCSTQYDKGGSAFGIGRSLRDGAKRPFQIPYAEERMGRQLARMEKRYPLDVWVFGDYGDNEPPNRARSDFVKAWNQAWRWPEMRTCANLAEPFDRVRGKWGDQLATLSGDLVSGWAQHTVSTPCLLADKFAADRLLPAAETASAIATLTRPNYAYPKTEYARAWEMLLLNDEHSYGTSGYAGRRVFETWMQHRDWIGRATAAATAGMAGARAALGLESKPAPAKEFAGETTDEAPVLENRFYRVGFAPDGAIRSLYDKELGRELLDPDCGTNLNAFLYTRDNHRTFAKPERRGAFRVCRDARGGEVRFVWAHAALGAEIRVAVRLGEERKALEIVNEFRHARDLFNTNRYFRYGYTAFPFAVPDGRFSAQLNGPVMRPYEDLTGHNTDAYVAARDWVAVDNGEFGVAVIAPDSHLFEFGKISPDKTVFGEFPENTHIYNYLFTDWLQMHVPSGDFLNPRFRYWITSFRGDWKQAHVPNFAESCLAPFPVGEYFRISVSNVTLSVLKPAEDGRGYIARFRETLGERTRVTVKSPLFQKAKYTLCNVIEDDEKPLARFEFEIGPFQFATVRMEGRNAPLAAGPDTRDAALDPYGKEYTALLSSPRAGHGESDGQLYLLWGRNNHPDFGHYELYRSENPEFAPGPGNKVADVKNEQYVCARYVDKGLKSHTRYWYRLRTVDKRGACGGFSEAFSGLTRFGGDYSAKKP